MRALARALAALAVFAVFALGGAARADDAAERVARARAHFERGRAQFNLGAYDDAIREFEEGYREKPQPLFLFNIAQAARKAGHLERALELFKRYLVVRPDAPDRRSVEREIREVEAELKRRPPPVVDAHANMPPPVDAQKNVPPPVDAHANAPPPVDAQTNAPPPVDTYAIAPPPVDAQKNAPPPVDAHQNLPPPVDTHANAPPPVEPPPAIAPPPVAPPPPIFARPAIAPPRRWYQDWVGDLLCGVGAAALLYGVIDFAVTEPRWANASASLDAYLAARDTPPRLYADLAVAAVGVALIAGGVARYVIVTRRVRVAASAGARLLINF